MKSIIVLGLSFLLSFSVNYVNAQVSEEGLPTIQQVIPPSPDATSLGKFGEIPVGKNTGTASIEVPFYVIDFYGLKVPISLNYHTGGIKVEELPGWVGQGWALNCGGMISKTVIGLPDNQSPGGYLVNSYTDVETVITSTQKNQIGTQVMNGLLDLEPDNYYFNIIGYSGKFFIDKATNTISTIPKTNLKFEYPQWTIVNDAGFKFYFVDGDITTADNNISGRSNHNFASSLVLSKIVAPNGKEINFSYQSYTNNYYVRNGQTRKYSIAGGPDCDPNSHLVKTNYVYNSIAGKRISEIVWDGGKVVFNKSANNREDLIGDYKLDNVKIYNSFNELIKHYKLNYIYRDSYMDFGLFSTTITDFVGPKRLFLESVVELSGSTQLNPYSFEYEGNLPYYLSFSQDHWGYFNGESNTNLLPKTKENFGYAKRNVSPVNSKAGLLNKVVYPTKGESKIYYEPNDALVSKCDYQNYLNPNNMYDLGNEDITLSLNQSTSSGTITTPSALCGETKKVFYYALNLPSALSCPGYERTCIGNLQVIAYNAAANHTVDLLAGNIANGQILSSVELLPSTTYTVEITGSGSSTNGVTLYLAGESNPAVHVLTSGDFVNSRIGGSRISRMENVIAGTMASTTKYNYVERTDILQTSTAGLKSSGRVPSVPKYYRNEEWQSACDGSSAYCYYVVLSSSSVAPLTAESGTLIGYKMVDEIKEGQGNNIRSVSTFTSTDEYADDINAIYPYVIATSKDYLRGLPLKEYNLKYSSGSNAYSYASEKTLSYTINESVTKQIKGVTWHCPNYVKPPSCITTCTESTFTLYTRHSKWFYQSMETSKLYSENPAGFLETVTSKSYSNSNHLLITSQETSTSQGETTRTDFKYPHDFVSQQPYADMVTNKHIWAPVIEKSISKVVNSVPQLLTSSKTNFEFWNGTTWSTNPTTHVVPRTVEVKTKGNNYENRLRYHSYDDVANITTAGKENDQVESYLWGYKKLYPVAKIANSTSDHVLHDNFEELTGWDGSLTAYDNSKSKTGKYSGRIDKTTSGELYSHSSKWLTVNLSVSKKFKYSAWVYSNGPSAEIFLFMKRANETGYFSYVDQIACHETNKWVLIEKDFDVPADVTQLGIRLDNNGGGTVWFDDVRLHPSDAMMTTYTYKPLVGMTSQTDVNNKSTYYEYDSFNRLSIVRDQDGKILKKICYNYAGQPEDCGSAVFTNVVKSGNFTKNNCGAGGTGSSVTYTVAAGTYSASTQFAADSLAQAAVYANGQAYANTNGTCVFSSYDYSGYYYSELCSGGSPTGVYVYAPAGMFTSTISLQDANNQAYQYAQNYANTYGSCTSLVDIIGFNYSYDNFYVTMTNLSTNEEFFFFMYENTTEGIGMVPPGNYNIQIDSWGDYHSYSVFCGNYSGGFSAFYYNITVDASCNDIQIY